MKIGVFDSGIGGITVLSELRRRLDDVDYVYLGDTAHLPYGAKSPAQIEKLSVRCAQTLKKKKIDALVVACNTASSWALEAVKAVVSPIPVFGVVEPGIEAALAALEEPKHQDTHSPILVFATRATVQSHAYLNALRKKRNPIPTIIEQACPILVPIIEEGWIDHPILHQTIQEYVRPHLQKWSSGVALLGCTHYPWIHCAFEKAMPGWIVVNSARAVTQSLEKSDLFAGKWKRTVELPTGQVEWIFTDDQAVPSFAKEFIRDSRR